MATPPTVVWPRRSGSGTRIAVAALAAGLVAAGCSEQGTGGAADEPGDAGSSVVASGADAVPCEDGVALQRDMSSGATWSLCFTIDPKAGMVIRNATFAPSAEQSVLVAHEMALAQLEVPYDTGARLTSDLTDAGFGGLKLQSLTGDECLGEVIEIGVPDIGDGSEFGETPVRPVLCSDSSTTTMAYRSEENGEVVTGSADAWILSTISKVGWYEYVVRYTFSADGTISPYLGATGDLSPVDYTDDHDHGSAVGPGDDLAASHSHNAVWRIHWALGGGPLAVEQYDARPTGRSGPRSPIVEGGLAPLPHPTTARRADRRWWRVVAPELTNGDGHPASYEIDLGDSDSFVFAADAERGHDTGYDVAFTNADDCAVFATANRGACGDGVFDYVAAAPQEPLTDVVSWVAVGFHHVPRDEDQSPMQLHWQGFSLIPRDLTAQRIDVPAGREDLNGQPETWNGEPVEGLTIP